MNMITAIAESVGNKAKATPDNGEPIIVQLHFGDLWENEWYTIWLLRQQTHFSSQAHEIKEKLAYYSVDPQADYWQSV
jgi:hypothetical protein